MSWWLRGWLGLGLGGGSRGAESIGILPPESSLLLALGQSRLVSVSRRSGFECEGLEHERLPLSQCGRASILEGLAIDEVTFGSEVVVSLPREGHPPELAFDPRTLAAALQRPGLSQALLRVLSERPR